MIALRKTLVHMINIVFFFPLVLIMFLYLIFRPKKMIDFYYGLMAITEFLEVGKGKRKVNDIH